MDVSVFPTGCYKKSNVGILKGCVNLPATDPSLTKRLTERLTVTPRANLVYGPAPKPFPVYIKGNGCLSLPRTFGLQTVGLPNRNLCVEGEAIANAKFEGTLKWYQKRATDRVLEEFSQGKGRDAMLEAGTGCGKTVMAISIVGQVRRKTAVLVHKDFLLNQWRERIEAFLPGVEVGVLQGPTCDHEGKGIVLCMIQSLVKRAYPAAFFDSIGLVVVDECHHIAAKTFSECLRPFGAAHRLGLTATPERNDGLERVVHWLLGPTVCRVERRKGEQGTTEVPSVRTLSYQPKGWKEVRGRNGTILYTSMITQMVRDEARNALIVSEVLELWKQKRRVMVVSERRKHLEALRSRLPPTVRTCMYVGETSKKRKRSREADALEANVLFSTYSMGEEGLDLPFLDTLVLATPKKRLDQVIGRILRHCEGKQAPLIVDVADGFSIFHGMGRGRARYYEAKGYYKANN